MDGVEFERRFGKRPHVEVDVEYYQDMIDDPDLNDEQKAQIIEALWSIIVTFVDLGFDVHPNQLACGQVAQSFDEAASADSDVVNSQDTETSPSKSTDPETG
ncbi:MAG: hypothetical protein AAFU81_11790 [Pseudomonadota bacterium]